MVRLSSAVMMKKEAGREDAVGSRCRWGGLWLLLKEVNEEEEEELDFSPPSPLRPNLHTKTWKLDSFSFENATQISLLHCVLGFNFEMAYRLNITLFPWPFTMWVVQQPSAAPCILVSSTASVEQKLEGQNMSSPHWHPRVQKGHYSCRNCIWVSLKSKPPSPLKWELSHITHMTPLIPIPPTPALPLR